MGCIHRKNIPEYWRAFDSARHPCLKHGVWNVFINVGRVCSGCPWRQTPYHIPHLVSAAQQVPTTAASNAIKANFHCVPSVRQALLWSCVHWFRGPSSYQGHSTDAPTCKHPTGTLHVFIVAVRDLERIPRASGAVCFFCYFLVPRVEFEMEEPSPRGEEAVRRAEETPAAVCSPHLGPFQESHPDLLCSGGDPERLTYSWATGSC